jgi:lysyl-tRNA synthetase class I
VLHEPNSKYVAALDTKEVHQIRELIKLLRRKSTLSYKEFESKLYAIPKKNEPKTADTKSLQRKFFQNIYQMLFGKNEGPRLAEFLWHLEEGKIDLLDIIEIHDRQTSQKTKNLIPS